jgi:hypothetical protein
VKVRIKKTPKERDIDGVSLEGLFPGAVRDVSALLGAWLIAEEYADAEMRRSSSSDDEFEGILRVDRPSLAPRERRARKR